MFPILFQTGSYRFSSLGFLVGSGFFVSLFLIWRRLREMGLEEEKIIDVYLLASLMGAIFSRIFYVLGHPLAFGFDLVKWFHFGRFPGFSFIAGVLIFLIFFGYFAKKNKWNFYKISDELVFGLTLFLSLAAVGQFLDGSNLGGETGFFWGVFFPGDLVRRHPVSLFEGVLFLLLWFFLIKIERRWRSWSWYKSKKEGFLLIVFLGLVFLIKFLLAFLKPAGLYSTWAERIIYGLLVLSAGAWLYYRSGRRLKKEKKWRKKI
ncbi:MAG: prolipoprotein diacylglyceryl transferase [Candidatus Pacebacteria bacterium]|nr:prolipoprotein diacylglyceryl transferase [Candidatus Paceibacterota bacterium]